MKYQIYAYDESSKLNHAGVHNIRGSVTPKIIQRIEKLWRKWREKYLAENPGNYPLREHHNKTAMVYYHPAGFPEKTMGLYIGEGGTKPCG